MVVIVGEPGIGKSRLLTAALESLAAGTRLIRCGGTLTGRDRPFATVLEGLAWARQRPAAELPVSDPLAVDLIVSDRSLDSPLARLRVVETVAVEMGRWLDAGPVCLAVEDLHWVDDSSLLVLEQLARHFADRPLTIVTTARPTLRSPLLAAIGSELTRAGMHRIDLGPLDPAEVDELLSVVGAEPGPKLRQVVAGASGNPLYIIELLAALQLEGAIEVNGDVAELSVSSIPSAFDEAVLQRLRYLPGQTHDVLQVAAVLGSPFSADDLAVVLDRPASKVSADLVELVTLGLIGNDGSMLTFRHDLICEAVYRHLPPALGRALHLQAARRLAAAGRPAIQVAHHYRLGAERGDRGAVDWLRRTADAVLSRSPAVAAELLRSAIDLLCQEDPSRDELEIELVVALKWGGRNLEALSHFEALVDRPLPPPLAARLELVGASALFLVGRENEAIPWYERLTDSPHLTEHQRARAVSDLAMARVMTGDLEGARRDIAATMAIGRRLGDDPTVCAALRALCSLSNIEGRTADALMYGEQARELVRRSPDPETARAYPHPIVALVLMDSDRIDEGRAAYYEARRLAEPRGDRYQFQYSDFGHVLADFITGRLDDVEVSLAAAQHEAAEVGVRNLVGWGIAIAARVAVRKGELDRAVELVAEGEDEFARTGPRMGFDWLLWAKALLDEARSDTDAAVDGLTMAWAAAADVGLVSQGRLIGPDLARLAMATGDETTARSVARGLEETVAASGAPLAQAVALRCRGLADRDPHNLDAAVELLRSSPRRLELADALRDAGRCPTGAATTAKRLGQLREALDIYTDAGAAHDAKIVIQDITRLGGSVRRASVRRPTFGWDSLTDTERAVADLVAQGLSNPEIARRRQVSPRTIESHLSHTFAKLGVSSRTELVAEVVRRER